MDLLLVFLLIGLFFLFLFFVFLYLKKDQELTTLFSQYEQLHDLEKMGEMRIEKREGFVAMVVHELRSPLSVIQGSADLILKNDEQLQKEQKEVLLSQIKTSAADLLKLVNGLLDVAKIEAGKFEVKKEVNNVNELLKNEVEYYMALARQKNIDVQMHLEEDIQPFLFDKDRVKQVLNNLLSNALKFTPNNGLVRVCSEKKDNSIRICIEDSGVGIPNDMKLKLFRRFVQVTDGENHRNDSKTGTGLGLAIAKGIIDAHGGDIWVEDNSPVGSTFCFTIPLKHSD